MTGTDGGLAYSAHGVAATPAPRRAALAQAAASLRHALDPAAFARDRLRFTPDPWQTRVLENGAKRVALVCSRQSGKSTVAALLASHTALYAPASLALMIAPTQRQSAEIFAKARHFLSLSGMLPARLPSDNAMSATLPSGSRIIALPGDNPDSIRGFSGPALVVADEAAFVADDLFTALLPALAVSNGRLLLLSTPNGKRGFFYEVVSAGAKDWHIERITAAQCPRITPDFIEEFTRTRGPYAARSEFGCEFMEQDGQYFADENITSVLSDTLPMLDIVF